MSNSEWLADRVASLLPKTVVSFLPRTTAGACFPNSPWSSNRNYCTPIVDQCCWSTYQCHFSCHGQQICTRKNQYCD